MDALRKFNNLQALTVNDNPFCKEEGTIQNSLDPTKNFQYPHSYEPIIAGLDKLKYLDYRPIDEDYVYIIYNYSEKNSN